MRAVTGSSAVDCFCRTRWGAASMLWAALSALIFSASSETLGIPWGDVASAFYSTGIPNIEVYMEASFGLRTAVRLSRVFGWALASRLVQGYLKKRIRAEVFSKVVF